MRDITRNHSRIVSLLLVALAVGAVAAGGLAAADEDDMDSLIDESIQTDTDILSLWVDVETEDDIGDASEVDVEIELIGVDEADDPDAEDDETTIDSDTLTLDADDSDSWDISLDDEDHEDHDRLDLIVETEDDSHINSSDWGTTVEVAGGAGIGGSLLDYEIAGIPAIIILAVVLIGAAVYRSDD